MDEKNRLVISLRAFIKLDRVQFVGSEIKFRTKKKMDTMLALMKLIGQELPAYFFAHSYWVNVKGQQIWSN